MPENVVMQRNLLVLLFLLVPLLGLNQMSLDEKNNLRLELSTLINDLRKTKGLQSLHFNDTLKKAADLHSEYMASKDVLTHEENSSKFETPFKRVKSFNGNDFELVGENALYSKPQVFPLTKDAVKLLANEMFLSWKNSPPHYANMTDPQFVFGDLGFAINVKKKIIYATHVFGTKGHVVNGQMSKNAFGLKKATSDCQLLFKQFSSHILNMGNSLEIIGNEVLLYYHDITILKKLFDGPKDGIAIDLISKSQLACGLPNQLDLSSIYDGILLKPVYIAEMLANNRADSDYRIITKVGEIPKELIGQEFSPSLIMIKNGEVCQYIYPSYVPSSNYNLIPIEPKIIDEPNIKLVNKGIVHSQVIPYSFHAKMTESTKLPKIKTYKENVQSVFIKSFSSVEGDSLQNSDLHHARANFIMEHIRSQLVVRDTAFKVEAKENWDAMKFQFCYYGRDEFALRSQQEIKNLIAAKDKILPWDELLFDQRQSLAIINYEGIYNETHSRESLGEFNLRTAIATNQPALANKALYVMLTTKKYDPDILFETQTIDFCKKNTKTIANYCALLSYHFKNDPHKTSEFMFAWLGRGDSLNIESKHNLMHVYTLLGTYLLDNWDVAAERLAHVIHPKKVELFRFDKIDPRLELNLQLTFIEYYGQINDGANIHVSFNYIADYFKKQILRKDDDLAFALFCNRWSRFDLSIDHLMARNKKEDLDEHCLFTLIQTLNHKNTSHTSDIYVDLCKKAQKLNPERWCNWLNTDLQVKRNAKVKRLYCESCMQL